MVKERKKTTSFHYGMSKIRPSQKNFHYYPSVDDNDFYEKIYKKKEMYIERQRGIPEAALNSKDTMGELCKKIDIKDILRPHQKLLRRYISPYSPYKNLLVMHGTGSGKTLTAIGIAESFIPYLRETSRTKEAIKGANLPSIYIISSREAQNNFKSELLFKLNTYLTKSEKNKLEKLSLAGSAGDVQSMETYNELIKKYNKRLTMRSQGGFYKFMGYRDFQNRTIGEIKKDKFGRKIKDADGNYRRNIKEPQIHNIDNCVIIVDEAHNLVNSTETNEYGKAVIAAYKKSKNVRLILLTATPITHRPKEIVKLLNILRLDSGEKNIKVSDVIRNNDLTEKGIKILARKSKGYVSFLRGYNIYTYPRRIDMGEIPKSPLIKYTKLVSCPMSKLQYETYENHPNPNKVKKEDMSLFNMVFPNPFDPKNGLYRRSEIEALVNAPKNFLSKHGIEFYKTAEGDLQLTGPILELQNIGTYSNKYYRLLMDLSEKVNKELSHSFIYTKLVKVTGSRLIREILLRNGYLEFKYGVELKGIAKNMDSYSNIKCYYCGTLGKNHAKYIKSVEEMTAAAREKTGEKVHKYSPARFIVIDTFATDKEEIKFLIDEFNSKENIYGEKIKIVIGSRVAREAIDFKRISNVFITMFDDNYATLEQVIGRASRQCSHYDLEMQKRIVKIYRYVSTIPNKPKELSAEELKYAEGEKIHIVNKKIERILKQNAFDCSLNYKGNVYDDEVEKYKNCETKQNPELCNPLCDYMDCEYKCTYEAPKKEMSFSDLDNTTYDLYYYQSELNNLKKYIKLLFKLNIIWTVNDIINRILGLEMPKNSIYDTTNIDIENELNEIVDQFQYVDKKYIYVALDDIIINGEKVINGSGNTGYIIYRGIYYIFQPKNCNVNIQLIDRNISEYKIDKTNININDFLAVNYFARSSDKRVLSIQEIKRKLQTMNNPAEIASLIGKLKLGIQQKLLEAAITDSGDNKLSQNEKNVIAKILGFFENFLIDNDKFLGKYNYSLPSDIVKSLYKANSKIKIIGHFLTPYPKCYINNKWIECENEIMIESPEKIKYEDNDYIIGYINKTKGGQMVFKLKYTSTNPNIKSIDKRKINKGFICGQHGNKNELVEIAEKLGVKAKIEKNTIANICWTIENKLRENEIKERKKNSNIKWFYEYIEILRLSKDLV